MRVVCWDDFVKRGLAVPGTAVTVGVFDGVHRGHCELLKRICSRNAGGKAEFARNYGFPRLESAAVTFRENPRRILSPCKNTLDIISLDEKLALFDGIGVNICVLIDFSLKFGEMTGKTFIELLLEKAAMRYLAVGQNFHCGGDRMNARHIKQYLEGGETPQHFRAACDILLPVMDGGLPVSSSRIRAAIAEGDRVLAERLLGRSLSSTK
ncbi:MAG: FAD synthetase family protein [Spirochaetaceae bacterium]|jgi:riboflavin kinase/FMN adenylyltransferase|nr:FAD synthetase family protein [Spirochaetaceae bacterium]